MTLREQLANAIEGKVVVMGIGNPCRGDDAAGSRVAQRICGAPGVHVIDAQDVPENYVRQIVRHQPDIIVLIDAVDLDSPPGSVALLEKNQTMGYWPSTHRLPISLLVDYLEAETRARILFIAIQPRQTAFLESMSPEVAASVESIAGVLNEVFETCRSMEPDSQAA
jgi:hydrogenase 3 maturation protease